MNRRDLLAGLGAAAAVAGIRLDPAHAPRTVASWRARDTSSGSMLLGSTCCPWSPGAQIVSQFIPVRWRRPGATDELYQTAGGAEPSVAVRPARPRGLHVGPELPGHPSPSPDILEAALSRPPAVAVRLGGLERPGSRGPEPPPGILAVRPMTAEASTPGAGPRRRGTSSPRREFEATSNLAARATAAPPCTCLQRASPPFPGCTECVRLPNVRPEL